MHIRSVFTDINSTMVSRRYGYEQISYVYTYDIDIQNSIHMNRSIFHVQLQNIYNKQISVNAIDHSVLIELCK
jgi:hypothetical protein